MSTDDFSSPRAIACTRCWQAALTGHQAVAALALVSRRVRDRCLIARGPVGDAVGVSAELEATCTFEDLLRRVRVLGSRTVRDERALHVLVVLIQLEIGRTVRP